MHASSVHLLAFLVSFMVDHTVPFAAIYKIMPDVELQWSDVLVGASVTSLIFTAGKQLIGWYLGRGSGHWVDNLLGYRRVVGVGSAVGLLLGAALFLWG